MADGDISLLAIYDKVASVDTKVESLGADVRAQLAHGARKLDDHETRIRVVEAALPDDLGALLADVREDHGQRRGRSALWSHLLTFAGSSAVATIIGYWLEHH